MTQSTTIGRWGGSSRGRRDSSRSRVQFAGGFNPLTQMGTQWQHAWWASDPTWSTRPADGGAVSSWTGVGGINMEQGTGAKQPTFRLAAASFNNQPCIEFDGVDDGLLSASDISTSTDPYTVVWIGRFTNAAPGVAQYPVTAWGTASCRYLMRSSAGLYGVRWPTQRNGTMSSTDTTPHFARSQVGTTDLARIDGTGIGLVGDPGADSISARMVIGADTATSTTMGSPYAFVQMAFVGIYPGDLATDASWDAFKAWITATYGIAIAA